jgi:nucleotide-binding universal stress UspA family protein
MPCSLHAESDMGDAIAHPARDCAAAALARELAGRLNLHRLELPRPHAASLDAALAVAPVGLRLYRAPRLPVVVLTPAAAASPPLRGSCVVCGVQDDADAACVAIAGALANGLGLPLVLVHVEPRHYRGDGRETVAMVARAAGLDRPEGVPVRLLRGPPGRTIAAAARRERAALVVVSESVRRLPRRAIFVSAAGDLVRRCEHPVLVCPRDPAAAMRLREALAPAGNARAWRT